MTENVDQDLGARLRLAREQSGLSLRQIADETKLSVRTLESLERNRISQLPGGIYRRAIVRSYASHVGLDPEATLRAFLALYPDDVPTAVQAAAAPSPERRTRPRWYQAFVSLLGAAVPVVAALVYIGSIATGADTPRSIADASPAPRLMQVADVAEASLPLGMDERVMMMITVSSATRLQVVADGQEVVARRVSAGEVLHLGLANDVVLMGDDAGAVHFSINGRAGRTLGESGDPLSAHILRDDYQHWLMRH